MLRGPAVVWADLTKASSPEKYIWVPKEGGVTIPVAQPWLGDRYVSETSLSHFAGVCSSSECSVQHRSPSSSRPLSAPRAAALSQAREAPLVPGRAPHSTLSLPPQGTEGR